MASLESLLTRSYAAQTVSGRTVDDKSIAMDIVHTSTDVITSVTLTSNTGIRLIDASTDSGSLAFNTYTNLGLLVDKINTLANWKARIIDGLRSTTTASSSLIPNSAITAVTNQGGESVFRVFIDQSVYMSVFYRVSSDRGVLLTDFGQDKSVFPRRGHRVKITGIKYYENVDAASLNGVRIYEFDPVTLTETQIWSATSVDVTATTHDFTLNPITAVEGNDLIVRVTDGTSMTDGIVNFLQVDYIRE